MKPLTSSIAAALVLAGVGLLFAADDPPKKGDAPAKPTVTSEGPAKLNPDKEKQNRWMELKLHNSQELFSDLTHGNLDAVGKRARTMQATEILEYWIRGREFRQRSEYHAQVNRYQFAIRELARTAEDDDEDGALEAWVSLNRSCIACHKLLRDDTKPAPSEKKPASSKKDGK